MTNRVRLIALLVSTFLLPKTLFAQASTPVVAFWSFEDQTNPYPPTLVYQGAGFSGPASTLLTGTSGTSGAISPFVAPWAINNGEHGLYGTNWPLTGAGSDPTKYFEFTVTPPAGYTMSITGLLIGDDGLLSPDGTDRNGPRQYDIRGSGDGYSSVLATKDVDINGNYTSFSATPYVNPASVGGTSIPAYTNTTNSVTFRLYPYNAVTSTGYLMVDLVRILVRLYPIAQPVELTYFSGKSVGSTVQLAWETSSERNAGYFLLERSLDAREFGTLGQISASGTTNQKRFYSFTDEQPYRGTAYYRLKQVDQDGTTYIKRIIAVNYDENTPALVLLGNPGTGRFIRLKLYNLATSSLKMMDLTGRSIAYRASEEADGVVTLTPENPLKSGLYLIRAGQQVATRMLVW